MKAKTATIIITIILVSVISGSSLYFLQPKGAIVDIYMPSTLVEGSTAIIKL